MTAAAAVVATATAAAVATPATAAAAAVAGARARVRVRVRVPSPIGFPSRKTRFPDGALCIESGRFVVRRVRGQRLRIKISQIGVRIRGALQLRVQFCVVLLFRVARPGHKLVMGYPGGRACIRVYDL